MAEAKPRYPLELLQAAAAEVGLRLGKSRAYDVVLVHVRSGVEAQLFAESLVANLTESNFIGSKELDPPFGGIYDEYLLPLPRALVERFSVEEGNWYVALKFTGSTALVYCISMHPSTTPGGTP